MNLEIVPNVSDESPQVAEEPSSTTYRTVAAAWKMTLDSADKAATRPPTMDWCAILISKWPFLHAFEDFQQVHDLYFEILTECRKVLDLALEDFPEALVTDHWPEDVPAQTLDAEENKDFYVHVLREWQKVLLVAQAKWDCNAPDARAYLVALGELQQHLVGQEGLASYLGVINLPFSEEEQEALDQELKEFRESLEE